VDRHPVQRGARPLETRVALAERRRAHDPEDGLPLHREGDQRGPDLDPVGEVPRPVDRVDDPSALAPLLEPPLLAEHRVLRVPIVDGAAHHLLDREIGLRHGALIGLDPDLEGAAEQLEGDLVRSVRELMGEGEFGLEHAWEGTASGHGRRRRGC
jgi:hypothetical protein